MILESPFPTTGPYAISKAFNQQTALLGDGEYCSVHPDVAAELGRTEGDQIRVVPLGSDGRNAAFTMYELHDDDAAIRISKTGRETIGVEPGAEVTVAPVVPNPTLTRMAAFELDDVAETVWDTGQDRLLLCAPHDGMESNTAQAAGIVRKQLGPHRASAWFVHAFGDTAFEQYHIRSANISPASYPGLATLAGRNFDHCITFHAWDGDAVLVGGLAHPTLRERLGDRISEAIGERRDVVTDHDEARYMAETHANIANRLTKDSESGIQIEMPPLIARQYRKRIARAVAGWVEDDLFTESEPTATHP